jgi:ketosteroid isomerase-like protein
MDTVHRRLCHTLFDAIEQGDLLAVKGCYASDMTMWSNITGEMSSREQNLAGLATGYGLHRRRTYNDRIISTFDDGFVAQYTTSVVTHQGSKVPLSACLVAEVRDGLIVRLFEYLDSGKFTSGRRSR